MESGASGKGDTYMITYRKAATVDIRPALELALKVFLEYDASDYGTEHTERMRKSIDERIVNQDNYFSAGRLMYVALDDIKVVGIIETYGKEHQENRVALMFVDGNYQREGIGTELMSRIVCDVKMKGHEKLVLNSSPYGLPFYRHFGFIPIEAEKNINTPWKTPMEYTPGEIWDVLDSEGNKTGRFHERGRKLAIGDYHLVVHVWKHNGRGEWLIDRRAMNRGTSIDGKWETTGGAALAGDDSLTAALRETKEELGIDLNPSNGILFHRIARHGDDDRSWFQDAWVFEHDCPIETVRFQESETCDAMWATADKIRDMMAAGEFLSEWFYPYFDDMVERWDAGTKI